MYLYTLASRSPRRIELLKTFQIPFEVKSKDVEEDFPSTLPLQQVPEYLAKKKALAFEGEIQENEIIIAADTVVILGDEILNKASNAEEATQMLRKLSGRAHQVITGICLYEKGEAPHTFSESTMVYFKVLGEDEIKYYIEQYKPYDKAGAYGIQEWIGMIGVYRIEGCFYNVMGLPLSALYQEMKMLGYLSQEQSS